MIGSSRSVRLLTVFALTAVWLVAVPLSAADAATAPTISGVSVSRGPLAGGTDVVVVGRSFTKRSMAVLGATKARVTYSSATRLVVRTPKHAAGTVHIRVTTSGRTSAAVKADRFVYTAAPSRLRWGKVVDATYQTAVSCASTTFCASVGEQGESATYRAGTWTTAVMPDTALMTGVSCATATFCAAVDVLGRTTVYNGRTWSAPAAHAGVRALTTVSCPTATFCMATDGRSTLRWNGATWTRTDMHSTTLTALSCTSPAFCLAVSEHRYETTWNGRTWSAYVRALPADLNEPRLDCSSPTYCVVADFYPSVYVRHGTTWSTAVSVDIRDKDSGSDFETAGLSCASDDFCAIALSSADNAPVVRPFQSAAVASPAASTAPSELFAVSCPTVQFCAAVGYALTTGTR